jgi:hypothetical protein
MKSQGDNGPSTSTHDEADVEASAIPAEASAKEPSRRRGWWGRIRALVGSRKVESSDDNTYPLF